MWIIERAPTGERAESAGGGGARECPLHTKGNPRLSDEYGEDCPVDFGMDACCGLSPGPTAFTTLASEADFFPFKVLSESPLLSEGFPFV